MARTARTARTAPLVGVLFLVVACLAQSPRLMGKFTGVLVNNMGVYASQAVEWNGDVVVTGQFSHANGVLCNGVALYNATTRQWHGLVDAQTGVVGVGSGTGSDRVLGQTALAHGDDLFIGGWFTNAGGKANTAGIARYSAATRQFSSVQNGLQEFDTNLPCWDSHETPYVARLYPTLDQDDVVAVGRFQVNDNTLAISTWDPHVPAWAGVGRGVISECANSTIRNFVEVDWVVSASITPDYVYAIGEFTSAVQSDGEQLFGGGIARFNRNSGKWETADQGRGGFVMCAAQETPIDWMMHTHIIGRELPNNESVDVWLTGPVVPWNQTDKYVCNSNVFAAYEFIPGPNPRWVQRYASDLNTRSKVAIFTAFIRRRIAPIDAVKLAVLLDKQLQDSGLIDYVISVEMWGGSVYITGFMDSTHNTSALVVIDV